MEKCPKSRKRSQRHPAPQLLGVIQNPHNKQLQVEPVLSLRKKEYEMGSNLGRVKNILIIKKTKKKNMLKIYCMNNLKVSKKESLHEKNELSVKCW